MADITAFKILINITLSAKDAAMMMMDIKNYYLGTPLPLFEYMKMLLSRFPKEIIQQYNLNALAVNGWVYIEIRKGMYGLKQVGLLANQLLQTRLAPFGYYPAQHTPGLWLHKTRPISFTLVVDDFAVKYVGKHHAEHLWHSLLQTYELVKLPQPQLHTRKYTQTGKSTLRATQVRAALSHAYAVTYQNRIMDRP
jgi:hypothetical protein